MKFSIKDFFSKCDQIRSFLRIWPHLLKKSLMENFIFCAVNSCNNNSANNEVNTLKLFYFFNRSKCPSSSLSVVAQNR